MAGTVVLDNLTGDCTELFIVFVSEGKQSNKHVHSNTHWVVQKRRVIRRAPGKYILILSMLNQQAVLASFPTNRQG